MIYGCSNDGKVEQSQLINEWRYNSERGELMWKER
jgi:hypothetical protein